LGYYADPALNPEATVWGTDGSTGRRFIQAEYLEKGLSDGKGGKLSLSWREDIPFSYSAGDGHVADPVQRHHTWELRRVRSEAGKSCRNLAGCG
jgi:hypothetical protein